VVILTFADVSNGWRYGGNTVARAFKADIVRIRQYETLPHDLQHCFAASRAAGGYL
jgi:hypothetical protein